MAKKAVASFSADKSAQRSSTKCIRMVRSERTGSYAFKEEMVQNEQIKDFFEKK
jgi:hypothetical protein